MIQRSHAASLQLSRETRERFVAATEPLIAPVARAIDERLTALASQTHGANWVAQSQAAWRKALASSTTEGSSSNSLSRLELIGDEVVETGILSSRLAQTIQDKANFELNDLRLRIQHLEGTHELDARDVLKPETLAKVLVGQWLAAGLSRELWNRVQEQVQAHMVDAVVKAYKEANA